MAGPVKSSINSVYYERWQEEILRSALKTRRILILSGPRQCGKTTLAKKISDPHSIYRNLDDLTLFEAAKSDPESFIKHDNGLMVIDEIQRIPELLRAIKADVDRDKTPGRYLLTGSSNIHALPQANESLAGRVKKIRLRPLSRGEYLGASPNFLKKAFKQQFEINKSGQDKDNYLSLALAGGYPEPLGLKKEKEVGEWYRDYIHSLLERDLKDIANIKRKDSMSKLLEYQAAFSSKLIQISDISMKLSIRRPTVESYMNALETLYLTERIRPWTKTDYSRIGKRDKFFMADTGVMTSLLKWNIDKIRMDGDKNGKLLETFVFNQLMAIIESQEKLYEIYHYRDRLQHEIDFLIENDDGNYLGLEVKAGARLGRTDFKHFKWFKANMLSKQSFIGVVLYTGKEVLRYGDGLWAVPISNLWI